MKSILFVLFSLSFYSCAKEAPNDAFIFATTPCYGSCPTYEVMVFSDGTIVFNGESNVKYKGVYKLPSNDELFTKLLALTDKSDFNSFNDNYGWGDEKICKERWTDNPSTILTLQYGGKSKTINHYHGCKGFDRESVLIDLEKQIKELLNIGFYTGT